MPSLPSCCCRSTCRATTRSTWPAPWRRIGSSGTSCRGSRSTRRLCLSVMGVGADGTVGEAACHPLVVVPETGTGDLEIAVSWDTDADLDLHVVDANGDEIYYRRKMVDSGGELDVESGTGCRPDGIRTEHVAWTGGTPPPGDLRGTRELLVRLRRSRARLRGEHYPERGAEELLRHLRGPRRRRRRPWQWRGDRRIHDSGPPDRRQSWCRPSAPTTAAAATRCSCSTRRARSSTTRWSRSTWVRRRPRCT